MTTEDLIEVVIDTVDPDELVDLLDLTTEDLMNMLDVRLKFLSRIDRFDFLEDSTYD